MTAPTLSFAQLCREEAEDRKSRPTIDTHEQVALKAAAFEALAGLLDKISDAVATDERALTLTDPSARASEQQYAEEEILQAAVSIAAGFQPGRERA